MSVHRHVYRNIHRSKTPKTYKTIQEVLKFRYWWRLVEADTCQALDGELHWGPRPDKLFHGTPKGQNHIAAWWRCGVVSGWRWESTPLCMMSHPYTQAGPIKLRKRGRGWLLELSYHWSKIQLQSNGIESDGMRQGVRHCTFAGKMDLWMTASSLPTSDRLLLLWAGGGCKS